MQKQFSVILICVCSLLLCACSGLTHVEELKKIDCTVECAEKSDAEAYVITYSNEVIVSSSGVLTIQNQNDFDIVTHLLADGEEERVSEIGAGGISVLYEIDKEVEYTLGCHADVDEGTEIKVMVYDGERADVL